jgi:hypothetical protein
MRRRAEIRRSRGSCRLSVGGGVTHCHKPHIHGQAQNQKNFKGKVKRSLETLLSRLLTAQ